jgi:GH24 family phage-related lysozyme (muramidase)
MRIWLTTTICFGLMAALCGVSLAAQESADPNGVSQEKLQTKEEGRSLQRQLLWDQVESIKEPANQPQTDTLVDFIPQHRSLEIPPNSISQEPN